MPITGHSANPSTASTDDGKHKQQQTQDPGLDGVSEGDEEKREMKKNSRPLRSASFHDYLVGDGPSTHFYS